MPEAQPYTSETLEIASAALGLSRRITVWSPKPARQVARNPVLYLNDGQNLFDSARSYTGVTWRVAETANWLIERGVIPPIVIVGIDHGELRRGREYLPVEDERNPFARKPLAAEYAGFITDELMPAI
jgi:predicted alpha/beta superfamily hydrolase